MKKKKEDMDNGSLDEKSIETIVSSIRSAVENTTDPKELAYSLVANYIWDRKKLKMTTRLTQDQTIQLIKSYIIIRFYQNFWSNKTINYEFVKIENPPLYKIVVDYDDIKTTKEYNMEFSELLDDIMELLISKNGLGREEAIRILSNAEREITIKDKALNLLG